MATLKCTCPACNVIFAPDVLDGPVTCPVCDTAFSPPVPPPVAVPVAAPAFVGLASPAPPPPARRNNWLPALAGAAVALLVCGIGLAIWVTSEEGPSRPAARAATAAAPVSPEPDPVLGSLPQLPPNLYLPLPEIRSVPAVLPTPATKPAPPPAKLSAQELRERVNQAIARGTVYLKAHGREMDLPSQDEGLVGLTLLECGVPRTDPVIHRIAASLRDQARGMNKTYVLATSIFFFDRLGWALDRPLICTLADRLIMGQSSNGTWTYFCPLLAPGPQMYFPPRRTRPPPLFPGASGFLPPQPAPMLHSGRKRASFQGDHSNTQFAALALWIAQRHGADVRPALNQVELHFREVQREDGSWGYQPHSATWRTSSTCAGLLGLAVGHGIDAGGGRDARLPFRPANDTRLSAGLGFLGKSIAGAGPGHSLDSRDDLYTLWSIERTAVIYNLQRIGETEWYPWAAEWLVGIQSQDGSWRHHLDGQVGTCFALLVLRRSNLVPDLTLALNPVLARKPAPAAPVIIARPGDGGRVPGAGPAGTATAAGRVGVEAGAANPVDERKRTPR